MSPQRPPSNRPSFLFRLYIAIVIVLGAGTIAVSIARLPSTAFPGQWAMFAVLGVLAGAYAVKMPGLNARISVSDTFFLASAILFGPAPAILALAFDSAIMSWRRSYGRVKLLFNACGPALSLSVATYAFFAIADGPPLASQPAPVASLLAPLAAMTTVWFGLNSGLTACAIALESRTPLLQVWRRFAPFSVNYAAAASAAFSLVIAFNHASLAAAAAVLPVVIIFHLTIQSWLGRLEDAQQHVAKVDRLYLSTIETLATAIEAKDGGTHDHIRRVQKYAVTLAKGVGVTDEPTIKSIEAAALLHDTGKLGIPEHILNKPGKLTSSEFDLMKRHVDLGADILSAIDFPYPVIPIVRCHHENWDGSGYPRGVRGTDIPVGARILSVVDCYDALTSDRPYRRALSRDEAIAILLERRGTLYDPMVVDTFIRILPDIPEDVPAATPHSAALAQISQAASVSVPAMIPASSVDPPTTIDLSEIASLTNVVNASSSLTDTLLLATMQVRRAIPRGTCAIYVLSDDGTTLEAGLASGPLESALRGASFTIGQGLTGWVAANRTTIVNSDARLDISLPGTSEADGQTCLSTALCDGSALRGVLTLYREASQPFSAAESRAAETLAPYIAEILGRLSQPRRVQDIRLTPASRPTRQSQEAPAAASETQPYCVA